MKTFIYLTLGLFLACTDNSKTQETTTSLSDTIDLVSDSSAITATSDSDTVSPAFREEGPATDQVDLDSLTSDSILIFNARTRKKEKLYGHRYENYLLFDGDILIKYVDTLTFQFGSGVTNISQKWRKNAQGKVVIPYFVSPTFPKRERITAALTMWTNKLPALVFRQIPQADINSNNIPTDHLFFEEHPDWCFVEKIGRQGGQQKIFVERRGRAGNIAHEIGHILGLFHEHCRFDRNKHVTVSRSGDDLHDFQYVFASEQDLDANPTDVGTYDFASIMHYPESEWLQLKPQYQNLRLQRLPGQRDSLSRQDVASIKKMYGL